MTRFHGKVGFGTSVETKPGVHADEILEYSYFGDVVQNRRTLSQGETLSKDLSIGHSISIVADDYARGNVFAIKYVEWAGERWTVTDVEVQRPRLILQLGEVYNGPTAGASVSP